MSNNNQSTHYHFRLGAYQNQIDTAIELFKQKDVLNRIWQHDYTVWKPSPQEITNRLAWLDIIEEFSPDKITEMISLRTQLIEAGYRHCILLGMGGSSLAPELFSLIFSSDITSSGSLSLSVLDSTCPLSVQDISSQKDLEKTAFIVSTKSGTTEETLSFFKYFYRLLENRNIHDVGEHFIAITDPGTKLEELARQLSFRHIYLNNPNLGGRYSALSYFGLAPAALCGIDIPLLLDRARNTRESCRPMKNLQDNPSVMLGLSLGELAKSGHDKMTFVASPTLMPFCDWIEQLIAESTGKEGKGILPVVDEPITTLDHYGHDRLFIILVLAGEEIDLPQALEAYYPSIKFHLDDIYDLGGQFFIWELATAIAGYCLGINPFDQPNVEATKKNVRRLVEAYKQTGIIPDESALTGKNDDDFFPEISSSASSNEYLKKIIEIGKPGDYVAIQAFVYPQKPIRQKLQEFRIILRDKTNLATTLGFGPRFLHSTGQLHKGDRGNGIFIQITSDFPLDLPIPDSVESDASSLSFGSLIKAQAMGDYLALRQANRRVIRFHLSGDLPQEIDRLTQILTSI